jgi:hypothetical protein
MDTHDRAYLHDSTFKTVEHSIRGSLPPELNDAAKIVNRIRTFINPTIL